MNKEIEIKAQVMNYAELIEKLKNFSISPETSTQIDILFDYAPHSFLLDKKTLKADEFLRIREKKQSSILTHKLIKRDKNGQFLYCDENEAQISPERKEQINDILAKFSIPPLKNENLLNAQTLQSFLCEHNFKKIIQIEKTRQDFKINEFNVALDVVKDLGTFIEVEQLVDETSSIDVEQTKKHILNFLFALGIKKEDIVEKGYIDLIMQKKGNG